MLVCKARREGDEMYCYACGLRWDISDPERPPCNPVERHSQATEEALRKLYEEETDK